MFHPLKNKLKTDAITQVCRTLPEVLPGDLRPSQFLETLISLRFSLPVPPPAAEGFCFTESAFKLMINYFPLWWHHHGSSPAWIYSVSPSLPQILFLFMHFSCWSPSICQMPSVFPNCSTPPDWPLTHLFPMASSVRAAFVAAHFHQIVVVLHAVESCSHLL